jgi:ATP-dependent Lhr-like helicase
MTLQLALSRRSGFEVQVMYTDDGIVLRFADVDDLPELAELLPDPDELEELLTEQLATTALFAALFRENAARSLLMPKRSAKGRRPLWAQRLKAQGLLATVRQYPAHPVVLETYRQALSDVFDLPALKGLLREIRSRTVRVDEVETRSASPFARALVFAYVAAYIYEQDAPLAERKAQALTLDRNLLSELLGQAELRELIDPDALAELAQELQHTAVDRRARDRDELHDLLRRLGDLSDAELAARCHSAPGPWLAELADQRRAVAMTVAGTRRWIAADDAGLYRDALGAVPPPGLPDSFLEPVDAPLEQLVRRYARTHGPFTVEELAARFGLRGAQVDPVLRWLESEGTVVHGEIRPGGSALDWCDAEVLRKLRRRTLARLRHEVAPVEARTLGRFLPDWHGIGCQASGPERVLEVIAQLEGLSLPWSALVDAILPARIRDFRLDALDMVAASGAIVWVGRGAAGPRDGRIALFRRDRVAELLEPPVGTDLPLGPLHQALLEALEQRGACFRIELEEEVRARGLGTDGRELDAAVWDLVWAGMVANDTFAPLRQLRSGPRRGGRRRHTAFGGGRWSLVAKLVNPAVTPTERALARARMLIERYGLVSREMAQAEQLPRGFGSVYPVLKNMEEAGRIRRGFFVEGLSGAQFSLPGALDRLRAARPGEPPASGYDLEHTQVLAAIDPANPYGALLPWPVSGGDGKGQPKRVDGAWVILVDGQLLLYLGAGGRHLLSFPGSDTATPDGLRAALAAIMRIPRRGRRGTLRIERIDNRAARGSPLEPVLMEAGFEADYRGLAPAA